MTGFNSLVFMFLGRGWKSFALDQGLQDGHVLHFKFDGTVMLFVKVFSSANGRLDCCMEGGNSGSSSPFGTNGSDSSSSSSGSGGGSDSDGSPGTHVKQEEGSD
ncbi:hypothetical protein D1007_21155 [Hordeum vulgare]|nr:hypothetical protein D1007_21155 [Hordeum vulgare]